MFFFFFKQKTAYEIGVRLVGSEMCIRDSHGGVLPFWLSPDQVAVAPISKDQAGYGADVLAAFEDAGIRAVAYDGADTLSRRIVAAHEMAVPVMAIVGGREMRDGRVSLRERDGSQADVPLACLLYTSPSPRDGLLSRMPSS